MSKIITYPQGIRSWAKEDRPREKFLLRGRSSLSEVELIAILIRSGTATSNAVEVARKLFQSVKYNLNTLAKLSIKDLMKHKGIGHAKAISIMAAMELGRRRQTHKTEKRIIIGTSQSVFELIKGDLMDLSHEEFWVILVNQANGVIKKQKISEGGTSGTVADPKIIYKLAVEELASGLIIVHNHPSGNLSPSEHDLSLTKKLKGAGDMLGINLLDHLIVSGQSYLSFVDQGFL